MAQGTIAPPDYVCFEEGRFVTQIIRVSNLLAVLVFVVGCNSSSTSDIVSPPCPAVAGTALVVLTSMIAPTSGATGVSPAIGKLEFYPNVPVGQRYQVTLTPTTGTPIVVSSSATQDTDNRGSDLAIPPLAAATTYTVTVSPIGSPACYKFALANPTTFATQ